MEHYPRYTHCYPPTQRASRSAAKAATASMSTSDRSGLDGVSTQTIFVSGPQAAAVRL